MGSHKVFYSGYTGDRRPRKDSGIADLESIFDYSFDFRKLRKRLKLTNNHEHLARTYLINKLKEAEKKKGFFDERDFELAMRSLVGRRIITQEQSDGIFAIAVGDKVAYKEEPKKEELSAEQKEAEDLETRDDLFSSRSSDEKDYDQGLLNEAQEADDAEAKEDAQRAAAAARAVKATRDEKIYKMGKDI